MACYSLLVTQYSGQTLSLFFVRRLLKRFRFHFQLRLLRLSELILIGMFAYRLHTSQGQIDDIACYLIRPIVDTLMSCLAV